MAALVAMVGVAVSQLGGGGGSDGLAHRPARGVRASNPTADPAAARARIRAARPGPAHVVFRGPQTSEVALTFDDGFCPPCAARIVRILTRTGAHATLFPNGVYRRSWEPLAGAIRQLIARHQVTIGDHTFFHHDPRAESAPAFERDLSMGEQWIERTFGVSARPFFRPPYGSYNADTLAVAGRLGFTSVINWSATVADSSLRTKAYILQAIRTQARPGAIILGHANYPTTAEVLPKILAILRAKHLRPVTLAELLGQG